MKFKETSKNQPKKKRRHHSITIHTQCNMKSEKFSVVEETASRKNQVKWLSGEACHVSIRYETILIKKSKGEILAHIHGIKRIFYLMKLYTIRKI